MKKDNKNNLLINQLLIITTLWSGDSSPIFQIQNLAMEKRQGSAEPELMYQLMS